MLQLRDNMYVPFLSSKSNRWRLTTSRISFTRESTFGEYHLGCFSVRLQAKRHSADVAIVTATLAS